MKIGIVWGTRDGDPLGGIALTGRDETSCAVLVHYSRPVIQRWAEGLVTSSHTKETQNANFGHDHMRRRLTA